MVISKINGVTKVKNGASVSYQLQGVNITVYNNTLTFDWIGKLVSTYNFEAFNPNFGATNAEELADYLVLNKYFQGLAPEVVFPTVQDVAVTNFPTVQDVTVTNFPTTVLNTIHCVKGSNILANITGNMYVYSAIRSQSTTDIKDIAASLISQTNDDFELSLVLGGVLTGTLTYNNIVGTNIDAAIGNGTQILTGGTLLRAAFGKAGSSFYEGLFSGLYRLTTTPIYLVVQPFSAGLVASSGLNIML